MLAANLARGEVEPSLWLWKAANLVPLTDGLKGWYPWNERLIS